MNEGALSELPRSWVWTRLGEIGEIITGNTPSKSRSEFYGKDFPFFKPTDLNYGYYVKKAGDGLSRQGIERARLLPANSILVTCIGATIGKTGFIRVEGASNQQINAIIPEKYVLPEFIYFISISPRFQKSIIDNASATTLPILNKSKFELLRLPLPSLPEQRAIISKIEQLFSDLDNGIENFKKAQAQLKLYRQSVLKAACEGKLVPTEAELARTEGRSYEAAEVLLVRILKERCEKWNGKGKYKEPAAPDITDLPMLPEGWGWLSIDQISQSIVDCLHSTAKFIPDGKYCIDTNCIEQGKILFEKARFVSEETYYERVSRLVPQADDILFAREGTIGTAVLVPQNIELCLGQRMMMFRAANGVIPLYFMWALQSQIFEKQWKAKVLGSTVPHVNIGDIKVMAMSLPPTFEQRRIVAEVERRLSVSDKLESTIKESLQKAESLRQSILKKAFEGKLLNQKELEKTRKASDWEPAEKLLERIKAEKMNIKTTNKDK